MTAGSKFGVLLMNLGSPGSTSVKDLRKYLTEFLMDGRVIDYPYIFRKLLVSGLIVPFRAANSAEAYKTIWTLQGSPLVVLTRQLQEALGAILDFPVEIAMRYGNPSMEEAYENLLKRSPGIEEIIAVPLYPHYAMSSYETAVVYAKQIHAQKKYGFKLSFIKPYFDQPDYIQALSENIRPYLGQDFDHLLFSYHGLPGRHIRKSDPTGIHCLSAADCCNSPSVAHATCYRHQVFTTTRLVTEKLNIPSDKFSISFQSRLGKGWLEPFTDLRLAAMPGEGIKKLLVVCPAFVSDCLETLEEIAVRGKETFMEAGGERYRMIPCLNTNPLWVATLKKWVNSYSGGDKEMLLTGTGAWDNY